MRATNATTLVFLALLTFTMSCATGPRTDQLVWDVLPFPKDSDWPGPKGAPAALEKGDLILQGQPVRSVRAYGIPLEIECDVVLEERSADDGGFSIQFVRADQPTDMEPQYAVTVGMGYRTPVAPPGKDGLSVHRANGSIRARQVWGEEPFTLKAGVAYHLKIQLFRDRILIQVNDKTYEIDTLGVTYDELRIQLRSWEPTNRWHVRNFVVR